MRLFHAISYFFKARPWSTIFLVTLALSTAFVEGLGIGFLVPLLESINEQKNSATSSQVSELLSNFYERIGVPFTLSTIMAGVFFLFLIQALLKYLSSRGGSWDLPGRPRECLGELRGRLGESFGSILDDRGGGWS